MARPTFLLILSACWCLSFAPGVQAQGQRVNGPLVAGPAGGNVRRLATSPDEAWAVYLDVRNRFGSEGQGLYSVRIGRGDAPRLLAGPGAPPEAAARVVSFVVTSDSTRVVCFLEPDGVASGVLAVVPIDGSAPPRRLHGELPEFTRITDYRLGGDGRTVVFRADIAADERFELFAVDVAAASAPFPVSGVLLSSVERDFQLGHGGRFVVYRAARDVPAQVELYAAPVDGTRPIRRLNLPLEQGGDVRDFQVSPDGAWAIYRAEQRAFAPTELFGASIAGRGPAMRLCSPLGPGRRVYAFEISPDSERVAYVSDELALPDTATDLFQVPIHGGPVARLNERAPGRETFVQELEFTPKGERIAFSVAENRRWTLYSVKTFGASPPLELLEGFVGSRNLRFVADGTRVLYNEQLVPDPVLVHALASVAVDGSGPPVRLSPFGTEEFVLSFRLRDAHTVLYLSDVVTGRAVDDFVARRLFLARVDGTSTVELGGPLVPGGDCQEYAPLARGSVLFSADRDLDGRLELFEVAAEHGAVPRLLSPSAEMPLGDVSEFEVSNDGRWAVYRADEERDEVFELYAAPLRATGGSRRISGELVDDGDVELPSGRSFALTPDGARVVYAADKLAPETFELYSSPIDGRSEPVRLTALGAAGAGLNTWSVSPDSAHVFYAAGSLSGATVLARVPVDGSAPAQPLSHVLQGGETILSFFVAPDASRVVYRVRRSFSSQALFSVPPDGGAGPVELVRDGGANLQPLGFSWDSRTLVYVRATTQPTTYGIHVVPADGSDAPRLLDTIGTPPQLDPAGARVVYDADRAAQPGSPAHELFSLPADGSSPSVELTASEPTSRAPIQFVFSEDGREVVFVDRVSGRNRLLVVPADGSSEPVLLESDFRADANRMRVHAGFVFSIEDANGDFRSDLVAHALDGSGARLVSDGSTHVLSFGPAPEGPSVAFAAVAEGGAIELHHARARGLRGPRLVAGSTVPGGHVLYESGSYAIVPDGSQVLYLGDHERDTVTELFRSFLPRETVRERR